MIVKVLLIALGGGIGSVCRYGGSALAHRVWGHDFPWGTLAVNVVGSLVIGFLWAAFERSDVGTNMRMFIFVGILGGFTTFSSYTLETVHLLRENEMRLALTNLLVSNVAGIAAVLAGFAMCRYLVK